MNEPDAHLLKEINNPSEISLDSLSLFPFRSFSRRLFQIECGIDEKLRADKFRVLCCLFHLRYGIGTLADGGL